MAGIKVKFGKGADSLRRKQTENRNTKNKGTKPPGLPINRNKTLPFTPSTPPSKGKTPVAGRMTDPGFKQYIAMKYKKKA
jgi:hypothetical protein